MMSLLDPHRRLARWSLRLSNFDFTVAYFPGHNMQLPDALSRCILKERDDYEVEDGIPSFELSALVVTKAGPTTQDDM